jgi:hypothetical protein
MLQLSSENQLMEYRMKRQYEYEKKIRLEEIKEKYSKLLITNKYVLSTTKIQRYLRKHFFHEPINIAQDDINEIPGLFRYRCNISQLNIFDFLDEKDDDLINSLMQSLNINQQNDFWIMIDLRIYGENINFPIEIDGTSYYLSHQQKQKISYIWNKINPNIRSGIVYQQNINYQKCLARDMKFIL